MVIDMESKAASMTLILLKGFSQIGPSSFSQLMRISLLLIQLSDSA